MALISHDSFIKKYAGKFLEFNGDQYKNQCMDLFWAYQKEVQGVNPTPFRGWGTAKNCYNNFHKIPGASKQYIKIANTPNNIPKKGDIPFWGTYPFVTGFAGHVAIYDEGGVMRFVTFDQNYPTYAPCRLTQHSYKGVMGWLRKI
jgi:hypothetical protein